MHPLRLAAEARSLSYEVEECLRALSHEAEGMHAFHRLHHLNHRVSRLLPPEAQSAVLNSVSPDMPARSDIYHNRESRTRARPGHVNEATPFT